MLQFLDSWELFEFGNIFFFWLNFRILTARLRLRDEVQIFTQQNVERTPQVYIYVYFEGHECLLGKK